MSKITLTIITEEDLSDQEKADLLCALSVQAEDIPGKYILEAEVDDVSYPPIKQEECGHILLREDCMSCEE